MEIRLEAIAKLFTFIKKVNKKEELNEVKYVDNYFLLQ